MAGRALNLRIVDDLGGMDPVLGALFRPVLVRTEDHTGTDASGLEGGAQGSGHLWELTCAWRP